MIGRLSKAGGGNSIPEDVLAPFDIGHRRHEQIARDQPEIAGLARTYHKAVITQHPWPVIAVGRAMLDVELYHQNSKLDVAPMAGTLRRR